MGQGLWCLYTAPSTEFIPAKETAGLDWQCIMAEPAAREQGPGCSTVNQDWFSWLPFVCVTSSQWLPIPGDQTLSPASRHRQLRSRPSNTVALPGVRSTAFFQPWTEGKERSPGQPVAPSLPSCSQRSWCSLLRTSSQPLTSPVERSAALGLQEHHGSWRMSGPGGM